MIHTDIDFPKDLPCALREGYDLNHVEPFQRTEMVSGRARNRRTFTSVPTKVDVSWLFNDPEAVRFEEWFKETANDGVEWFNLRLRTPLGMEDYVCRFMQMYTGPHLVENHWKITARLEIYKRPMIVPGWGLLPDYIIGSSIFDLAMNREWPKS